MAPELPLGSPADPSTKTLSNDDPFTAYGPEKTNASERLWATRTVSSGVLRRKARTGDVPASGERTTRSPFASAGASRRARMRSRYRERSEAGSPDCAATFAVSRPGANPNQGVPVVNPPPAEASHGIGVRFDSSPPVGPFSIPTSSP